MQNQCESKQTKGRLSAPKSGRVAVVGKNNEMAIRGHEAARYLELGGEQVYAVEYGCENPVALVLLCGPFPSDRLFSLGVWAKWGRSLAAQGIAAIRFDYRGTGESTGNFARMDFSKWLQDIRAMGEWVATHADGVPLILHGMGMGALLAQKAFTSGLGKGLLMWSAPAHGTDILKQGLVVRLSMDMLLHPPGQRKTAQQYIDALRAGETVQVDGYPWSGGLWATGEALALDKEYAGPGEGSAKDGRPWRHLVLGDEMAPLSRSTRVLRAMNPRLAIIPDTPLNPDFPAFFEQNASWLRTCAQQVSQHACYA